MFRPRAVEQMGSSQDARVLLVARRPAAWLPLLGLALICVALSAWALFGRIPVTVDGVGVLIHPGDVRALQSHAEGRIDSLLVRPGQQVRRGELVARLAQPEIQKAIEQAQAAHQDLVEFDVASTRLEDERWSMEESAAKRRRGLLTEEIERATALAASILAANSRYSDEQRGNLEEARRVSRLLTDALANRFQSYQQLKTSRAVTEDALLDTEITLRDSQLKLADFELDLRGLDLGRIETDKQFQTQQERIADLTIKTEEIDINLQRLKQQLVENQTKRKREIGDAQRQLDRLELELDRRTQITCEYDGRILEVSSAAGQMIDVGGRLATLDVASEDRKLRSVAYFAIQDGKRIRPDMPVAVTPTTVKRERYGSIVGQVAACAPFPQTRESVAQTIGSQEIAARVMPEGGAIEIETRLGRDASTTSGYRWTSQGPPTQFSAGTTTRVRVTLEQRAPITWLLPILRETLYGSD